MASQSHLKVLVWNARSINNKCDDTMCLLQDNHIDIAFLTETWLTDHSNSITADIKSYGYTIIHEHRIDLRGGGAALLFRSALQYNRVDLQVREISTFEYVSVSLSCTSDMKILLLCIYRTGTLSKKFFHELDCLLSVASLKSDYILIGGDFNIHMETVNEHSTELNKLTSSYGLHQIIDQPTHINDGTIDLLFDNSNLIDCSSIEVFSDFTLSDHFPVLCSSKDFHVNHKKSKIISVRDLKSVEMDMLSYDISCSLNDDQLSETFEVSCRKFFLSMNSVIDKYAPLVTKTISYVPNAPWFDSEYKNQRKLRRKAEKNKNKSEHHRTLFHEVRAETTIMANEKKKQYYKKLTDSHKGDIRSLYKVVNRELDRKQDDILPGSDDIPALSKQFNEFFNEKVQTIRANLPLSDYTSLKNTETVDSGSFLNEFTPCTEAEISNIIKESGIKCAPTDFLPESILKDNIDTIIPTLCNLVNQSLSQGSVDGLKIADVIPTLKGVKLDPNDLKNYRPISNLSFLGKLIERVVLSRLNEHLEQNNLNISEESAYKKNHSTETILLKVTNDLLIACDNKSATVVMMLDLSAAFDTVDHHRLLKILSEEIKIRGVALKWFKSFLMGRSQRTRLGSVTSDTIILQFGVPQGSVLGPILFNIYIRSLYGAIRKCGFQAQGYADDQQVYKCFKPCDEAKILNIQITNCFKVIHDWMTDYCLQLNPSKTQAIIVAPSSVLNQLNIGGIILPGNVCVRFKSNVRNLGITLDSNLSFEPHISALKKDCFCLIRNVVKKRFIFSTEHIKLIDNSIIVCRLDYCNAFFYGVNDQL